MKANPPPPAVGPATLQTVLDRLAGDGGLSDTRKRDLRSAVTSFAKLRDQPPAAIPLDLADIRRTLDGMVPARAKITAKRWANLRSDLAAAIEASGLRPMLKTAYLELDEVWTRLLAPADQRVRHGLSRFARWASLRRIAPEAVHDGTIDRFAELDAATLIRNLGNKRRTVALAWNAVRLHESAALRPVSVPPSRAATTRIPWLQFPGSFREDVERYVRWAGVPDPLAEGARARALAPLSLRLQQTHIHSATVADAVHDYLDTVRAEKGPAAERKAKYIFNASILPELGPLLVDKLTADRLLRWRNSLATRPKRVRTKRMADRPATRETPDNDDARRKRKATANRILTMLKTALTRAFQAGRVASDQAWRRVKSFAKVDEAVVRYLTAEEARRLVNACNDDFRPLVQAALLTGCRYSELARLRASAFNLDSGTLAIRLSKGKVRHVILTNEGMLCFATWTVGRLPTEHVFLRDDGSVWGPSHQQRPLEAASKKAGIAPPLTFHVLRHTHASQLAMRGVPMAVIAKQLGHADTRMTEKHYAHLAPNYVAETIRASFPNLGIGDTLKVVPLRVAGKTG